MTCLHSAISVTTRNQFTLLEEASVSNISNEELVYQPFVTTTQSLLNKDGHIDLYLHKQGGNAKVAQNTNIAQTISTYKINSSDQDFF